MPEPLLHRTDLERLCALARLRLVPGHEAEIERRLEAVVAAFASLAAVDTSSLPADEPETALPRLRTDDPGPVLDPAQVLANASRTAAGAFLVPRVVDG
jgi:aspartyl/glutamyl-tRNA(Asn/Gln) amidotransferase C subunit